MRQRFMPAIFASAFVAALIAPAADARQNTTRITFAKGEATKSVSNSLVREDRDVYLVRASAGQTMHVSIASFENNAAFQVEDDHGEALPDAEEVVRWTGELPEDGDYRIMVLGTRGNATYTLMMAIEPK
jgi:hypothetical protein